MSQPLPQPNKSRWQPLRLGLVEFFHYDAEEFWLVDGHLLLRGNNGTGKSKVLSLTLPFLLDANLAAHRVEPDGDRSKRMEWNLLLGKYEQRTGYSWIEFGRVNEQGETEFFTLGCGMKAVQGRARPDAWFFHSRQRAGLELHLVSESRVALNREALAQALGSEGRIAANAQDHRRTVDEKLFGLGEPRYAALMDTLIQLRQPQLSKDPDEKKLSLALSNALPPLPQGLLDDVAEAMNQLDQYREELQGIEALRDAVTRFNRSYRRYAQVLTRRQARDMRQAQTAHEKASEALKAAQSAETDAAAKAVQAKEELAAVERQFEEQRTQLSTLREDPQARDYANAKAAQTRAAQEEAAASRRRDVDQKAANDEVGQVRTRQQAVNSLTARHAGQLDDLRPAIAAAGLGDVPDTWWQVDTPADTLRLESHREISRRREQLEQVRKHLSAVALALTAQQRAKTHEQSAADAEVRAEAASKQAGDQRDDAARSLQEQWQQWVAAVQQLQPQEPEALLAALAEWTVSLDGSNPAREAVLAAQRALQAEVASQRASANDALHKIEEKDAELSTEEQGLREGRPLCPAAVPTRDEAGRATREGAPLWQLIEFHESLGSAPRAAIEAALQASGLLDAWLTPEGHLFPSDALDAVLLPRNAQPRSLLDVLTPAIDVPVTSEVVTAVLGSIACTEDDPCSEAWIGLGGRYRLGPLAGRWQKPEAAFIGHAAREAARQKRLAALAAERAALATSQREKQDELATLMQREANAEVERKAIPDEEALRRTDATATAFKLSWATAQDQLVEAAARFQKADQLWREAGEALAADARDLHLPADEEGLRKVEVGLNDLAQLIQQLAHLREQLLAAEQELQRQQTREQEARDRATLSAQDWQAKQLAAQQASARFAALQASIGSTVEAIRQRIETLSAAVAAGERNVPKVRDANIKAQRAHATAEGLRGQAAEQLEAAETTRLQAALTLQRFVETQLLLVAVPEAELPERWTQDASLQLARRVEQALAGTEDGDATKKSSQEEVSRDFTELNRAINAQGVQAAMETNDFGMTVQVFHANRSERPDALEQRLTFEAQQRREILSSQERTVLENHLQSHIAVDLQALMKQAEAQKKRINAELEKRPTSTGVRFKLDWEALPETAEGVAGFASLRQTLLHKNADAWSPTEREVIGRFLQGRIQNQRLADGGGTLAEHLAAALDYRLWHRYRVSRSQGTDWKPLSGPASGGEKALGLTVPLFAAASGHYSSCRAEAPRLVLLDEAFAGIDDEARAHCMGLIGVFDLDFVMTSEREWGCHATLPGVAIAQLQRFPNLDAVHVSRWRWDGLRKQAAEEPARRP